jgi:hypothetical protein
MVAEEARASKQATAREHADSTLACVVDRLTESANASSSTTSSAESATTAEQLIVELDAALATYAKETVPVGGGPPSAAGAHASAAWCAAAKLERSLTERVQSCARARAEDTLRRETDVGRGALARVQDASMVAPAELTEVLNSLKAVIAAQACVHTRRYADACAG